jgi:hypothetical protein
MGESAMKECRQVELRKITLDKSGISTHDAG